MSEEIWKDIKGYEDMYQISNHGRVKSLERTVPHGRHGEYTLNEKMMKLYKSNSGYIRISLNKNNKKDRRVVHRIVANHFLHNPLDYKQVNHKDGNDWETIAQGETSTINWIDENKSEVKEKLNE